MRASALPAGSCSPSRLSVNLRACLPRATAPHRRELASRRSEKRKACEETLFTPAHVLHGLTRFDLEQLEELLNLVAQTSACLGRACVVRPPRATPPAHHAAAALRHAHTQLADGGYGGARDRSGNTLTPGWSDCGLPSGTGSPSGRGYEDLQKS